ncbi:MAG: 30S ribosomal protein S4 [Nitrospirota bacterium]
MARYIGSVCRLCRREGVKLFLKGDRCFKDKCAIERRNYAPGQHGQRRSKVSDYGVQLREKQKVRRVYGVMERQFRGYFEKAERKKGITGENLLRMLEQRLDNVVYRLGFTFSRNEARQFLRHGHIDVNGRRVTIPSFLVSAGDVVSIREKSRSLPRVIEAMAAVDRREIPSWLVLEKEAFRGRVASLPTREDIQIPVQEQLIVELYSK